MPLTQARKYLITKQQFVQVDRQENNKDPDDSTISIDFKTTIEKGETQIPPCWYGRIIYLRDEQEYPVFTFTARWNDDNISLNNPGEKYLRTIIIGLKETHGLSDDEVIYNFALA